MKVEPGEVRKLGETQTLEFKKSLRLQKEAFKDLCGMINSDSATGVVVFGVLDDGRICGVEPGNLDSIQKTLAQRVQHGFDPKMTANIKVLECDDKHLVLLEAHRAAGVAYHEYEGRAFIREGSTRRQLSYDEKQRLAKTRDRDQHTGPWKCDRCGTIVRTLSAMAITSRGVEKSYACHCGGEYWPIAQHG